MTFIDDSGETVPREEREPFLDEVDVYGEFLDEETE
jgi:hypothetical protein